MERSDVLWLASLTALVVFVVLDPLLSYVVFGSDTGEYYSLTVTLITTGHLPSGTAYLGWGFAYPDFPGIFILAGATAQGAGVDPLSALIYVIPVVAVLSVLPLFLLFRRVFRNDTIAILAAGLATVAFPRMFSIAHPAPLALGDFLVIAGLWLFVEGRKDLRWYFPLALVLGTLILTHHLSSFFFALSALGIVVLLELVRPGGWSRRFPTRELVALAAFLVAMWTYWLLYAVAFRPIIFEFFGSYGNWAAANLYLFTFLGALGLVAGVALAGLLLWVRRSHSPLRAPRLAFPSDRSYLIEFTGFVAGLIVGLSVIVFVPLPGTSQTATVDTLLWVAPLILVIALTAGTHRMLTASRLGFVAVLWAAALALGVVFSTVIILTHPQSASAEPLAPGRFAEYFVIPIGLMAAVGIARLVARWGDVSGRRALVAGGVAVVVLVAANAAIAFPPPAVFSGFQEGYTAEDAAIWGWMGIGIPSTAVVASDHRMSSMIFGVNGNPATWDSTPALFTGNNRSEAFAELNSSQAPRELLPINVVVVDSVMYSGVALNPGSTALPLSPEAQAWLGEPPFVPLYENGLNTVYWVAWEPS